jgi:hypothetical protein
MDPIELIARYVDTVCRRIGCRDHSFLMPCIILPDGRINIGPCTACGFRVLADRPHGELVCPFNAA